MQHDNLGLYTWCSDGLPHSFSLFPLLSYEFGYATVPKTKDLPDNQANEAGAGNTLQDGICGWVFTFAHCYNNFNWNSGNIWYGVIPTSPTGAPKVGVYTMTRLTKQSQNNQLEYLGIRVTVN